MSPEIVKKPAELGSIFLVIPLIIVIVFLLNFRQENPGNNENSENNEADCIVSKVNAEDLAAISAGKIAEEINQKPLCRDVCLGQIKNSKENSDWQVSNDIRNVCKEIGLPLPVK